MSDRRTFFAVVGGAGLAGCAILRGGAVHARATSQSQEGSLRLRVADAPDLAKPGGVVMVTPPGSKRSVLIARTADGAYLAVAAECMHWGCIVDYNSSENTWDCPCHGSRYEADGKLLHGPAEAPLQSYPVRVEGEELVVAI